MRNNTVTAAQYLEAFANAYCGGDVEKAKRQLIPQMVIENKHQGLRGKMHDTRNNQED